MMRYVIVFALLFCSQAAFAEDTATDNPCSILTGAPTMSVDKETGITFFTFDKWGTVAIICTTGDCKTDTANMRLHTNWGSLLAPRCGSPYASMDQTPKIADKYTCLLPGDCKAKADPILPDTPVCSTGLCGPPVGYKLDESLKNLDLQIMKQ
jgi:hypothetical protein